MKNRIGLALSLLVLFSASLLITGCGAGNAASNTPPRPSLAITTNSLPAGNVGADYLVTLCSSGGSGANDNWKASVGVPPGLTFSLGGPPTCAGPNQTAVLFGTPTQKGTFNFSVTVTDTVGASATKGFSVTIGAPLPLVITTTSPLAQSGQVNISYGNSLQATGGVQPFTWSLTSGSLPNGLSLSNSGGISGTPAEFGTFSFKVTVGDSETPAQTATADLSLTINTLLLGQYTFLFQGFDANGAVVAAGSFAADGQGGISGGVEDVNRHVTGPVTNASVTGSYSIGLDNRGTVTLTSAAGTSTFAFALNQSGGVGRFIELDSSGTRGSGELEGWYGPCPGFANPPGPYVFGVSGDDLNKGRVAIAGNFQSDAAGKLSGGVLDENDAGALNSDISWTGTSAAPAGSIRCTMTISPTGASKRNFAYYPPFIAAVDGVAAGVPLVGGTVLQVIPYNLPPAGSLFTNASLNSTMVGSLIGYSPAANGADAMLLSFSPDGNGNVSITEDENNGGTVTVGTQLAGTYDVSATGRVTLTAGANPPVLYLVSSSQAFILGTDDSASLGLLEPQSSYGPDGAFVSLNSGTSFRLGTENPGGPKVADLAGVFDGTGAASGTWEESKPAANLAGQSFTDTYSITNSPANGSGTLTITPAGGQPVDFVFLSLGADQCTNWHYRSDGSRYCVAWTAPYANKLIAIPSDATQTNPEVLVIEQ